MNRPPSGWTQMRLLLGLAVRRQLNRSFAGIAAIRASRKSAGGGIGPAAGTRRPTPRRKVGTGLILVFFTVITLVGIGLVSWHFLEEALPLEGALNQATFDRLSVLKHQAADGRLSVAQAGRVFRDDPALAALPEPRRAMAADDLARRWATRRNTIDSADFGTPTRALNYPALHEHILAFASLAFLLMLFWSLATSLGLTPPQSGQADPIAIWLTSLPVPASVLLATLTAEYTLLNLFFWQTAWPFLTLCAVSVGHGWASPVLAFAACLPVAAALAAVRLAVETASRMYLTPARRKDVQIACALLGMVFVLALYGMLVSKPLPGWARMLAGAVDWATLPTAWPVRATLSPGGDALPWLVANGTLGLGLAVAGTACCAWLVRGGFPIEPDTLHGARQARDDAYAEQRNSWLPLSLLRKDLLLLRRDRAFLFQVLALPVFIIGLQLLLNPNLASNVGGDFREACTLAFVLGAYLLLFSATGVVNVEGAALWLATSAPQPLARLLLQKVALWTALALVYALAAIALAVALTPWPGAAGISDAVMVLVGVPLFAVIAAGMGAVGSDPLAVVPQQRMDAGTMVALTMVMSMYAQAIYVPHAHFRLLWIMLGGVFAYALWQQLEERLPWLLDPVDRPPRRLYLSDGALAAMGFMFICSVLSAMLTFANLSPTLVQLFATGSAGALVALAALWLLWRNGLPDLLRTTGLRPAGSWRRALPLNLAWGMAGGLTAALICAGYLAVLRHFPLLGSAAATPELPRDILFLWIVIAAPLTEEFIFRGLLFSGLRTTVPVVWAVPASAAIFALIHPTAAILPVFVLGCITAVAYRRTGWLLAPMLAHGIYNGALLLSS